METTPDGYYRTRDPPETPHARKGPPARPPAHTYMVPADQLINNTSTLRTTNKKQKQEGYPNDVLDERGNGSVAGTSSVSVGKSFRGTPVDDIRA